MKTIYITFLSLMALILSAAPALAAGTVTAPGSTVTVTSLTSNLTSPQPVGTDVTWTATATGASSIEYQFSVAYGVRPYRVVQDFSPKNTFTWSWLTEGTYRVLVVAQQAGGGGTPGIRTTVYVLSARVTTQPTISLTANPLVALFSAPGCSSGAVFAIFGQIGSANYVATTSQPCVGLSYNTYLGGLKAQTGYWAMAVYNNAGKVITSPAVAIATGTVTEPIEPTSVIIPAGSKTSTADGINFFDLAAQNSFTYAYATDLRGNLVWYYPLASYSATGNGSYMARPVEGGTILMILGGTVGTPTGFGGISTAQALREVDLAGNTIRETNVGRINEQLAARGDPVIDTLSHEAIRLPSGHTLVLGSSEMLSTSAQGGTPSNPVDIIGDQVIDLDANFQVSWVWNSFVSEAQFLNRTAILNEKCGPPNAGCIPMGTVLATTANDWLHSNALAYDPADGNVLISQRHQDWIIKIDYAAGSGDGHILWELGNQGSFTLTNPNVDPSPWFSHQHGIWLTLNKDGSKTLNTFDDGNTRCQNAPSGTCQSRGQVWTYNESAKTATLDVNQYLGNYSGFLGWGQPLANGDYTWTSGGQSLPQGGFVGDAQEYSPSGVENYEVSVPSAMYREYRLVSMYKFS